MSAFDDLDKLYKEELKELREDYDLLYANFTEAMKELEENKRIIRMLVEYIGFESLDEAKEAGIF